ncbi:MAG: hypothetical protein ACREMY_19570, partial [bacterium]
MILSAPSKGDDVETVVHGVNTAHRGADIISCARCTTNCITPVMEILGRRIGVRKAIMTTVHAYTASQHIVDGPDLVEPQLGFEPPFGLKNDAQRHGFQITLGAVF